MAAAAAHVASAQARAEASSAEALIAHMRLTIEKLKREIFGPRDERKARLLEQMELQLEEFEAAAAVTLHRFAPSAAGGGKMIVFPSGNHRVIVSPGR